VKYWLRRNRSTYDWLVWQVMSFVLRRKLRQTRRKVAAVGIVVLVLAAGYLAARRGED